MFEQPNFGRLIQTGSGLLERGEGAARRGSTEIGYAVRRGTVAGRVLLDARKQRGLELVKRLKDGELGTETEAKWWALQVAAMVRLEPGTFASVTNPPSSGKRAHHLATVLAQAVAEEIGLPWCQYLNNPNPRGRRLGGIGSKLTEESDYELIERPPPGRILLVDDFYCTGRTLQRCERALHPAGIWLAALAGS